MNNYMGTQTLKLFREHDGMFVYLRENNNWGKVSREVVRTNDPLEASRHLSYSLAKHVDTNEGEWLNVTIETSLTINEKI